METLTGPDVCVCVHTALRKLCDSKITSAAYNLVHLIKLTPEDCDPWRVFGSLVAEEINNNKVKPVNAFKAAVDRLTDTVDNTVIVRKKAGKEVPELAFNWAHALSCIFECFTKSDIESAVYYLEK